MQESLCDHVTAMCELIRLKRENAQLKRMLKTSKNTNEVTNAAEEAITISHTGQ